MFLNVEIATPGQGLRKAKLDGPEITLGRDPACQVPFDAKAHSAVSWHHARIEIAAGGASVSDLGSSNGTFVNGAQLTGKKSLVQGDVIGLGHTGPKLRIVEIVTKTPPTVPQTIAEKLLPHGMLTPPTGTKPINISTDSLPARPLKKRRRSPLGGIALGLLAIGAVAAAGYVVFTSQQKTNESKDENAGDKPKDAQQSKTDGTPEKKDEDSSKSSPAEPPKADTANPGQPSKPRPPVVASAEIYRKTLQSTGWVNANVGPLMTSMGTGALVDEEKRLFLTAYHVIANSSDNTTAKEASVYFPLYDAEGLAIAEPNYYLKNARPVIGDVIWTETKSDLAVLRLRSLPSSVAVLPLAPVGIKVTERIYTVGNPGASGSLWVYSEGKVRQVILEKFRFDNKQQIEAWMIKTDIPINPGDSGGPVVNERIELVGVNCSFVGSAQLMSNCVDLREIVPVLEKARRLPVPSNLSPGIANTP